KRISHKRTKNEAKNDKTEHGMEEHEIVKVKVNRKSQKDKAEAETEEILNGPTRTHLMGQINHLGDKERLMARMDFGTSTHTRNTSALELSHKRSTTSEDQEIDDLV
ncbi:hypothetical protein Tco_1579525, partial [Tanacetum coccineum]